MGCRRQPRYRSSLQPQCAYGRQRPLLPGSRSRAELSRDGALLEDVSCAVIVGDMVALRAKEHASLSRDVGAIDERRTSSWIGAHGWDPGRGR